MIFIVIPYLLLELYFSLKVGEEIGFFWSALWIVVTMVIGIRLLQSSPLALMGNFAAMSQGKLTPKGFHDAATYYVIGAILLIIPGVLSDFIGIIALFYTFYLQLSAKIKPETKYDPFTKKNNQTQGDNDVIDVEIISEYPDSSSSESGKQ